MSEDTFTGLRPVPYMGVIFVVAEACKRGFYNGHPDWSNLGQGQPEVGDMEGAPPRLETFTIRPEDHAYGPLEGIDELRETVAAHYNRLYRQGKASQYTAGHVGIAQGGRLALTRAMATLGSVNVGYQLPDYTAYEDMFNTHLARLAPVPVRTEERDGFKLTPERYERAIEEAGLTAFVVSNPCNPTGMVVRGEDLKRLVDISREHAVTLLLDEFYSHFIYDDDHPVSGAAYVDDVDTDPIILFDGLTKSYRYPGWRVGWVVGPPPVVESMARAASAIDGGPSRIAQRAAVEALQPAQADQETAALRAGFKKKRDVMVEHLQAMGVRFAKVSESTFYCWGCLDGLPEPLNDAMTLFWKALDRKVMLVPGQFFDVNPGGYRIKKSPYENWMRFSFGPPMDNMVMGLDRLAELVAEYR
ncbi:MAG: pyridoxal phosphate-dependent aminotransferase [Planctomycetota bacterium]|nr:pyridoxal phosphate-dependent aminotransferase [Planctomycetota bacterium]